MFNRKKIIELRTEIHDLTRIFREEIKELERKILFLKTDIHVLKDRINEKYENKETVNPEFEPDCEEEKISKKSKKRKR